MIVSNVTMNDIHLLGFGGSDGYLFEIQGLGKPKRKYEEHFTITNSHGDVIAEYKANFNAPHITIRGTFEETQRIMYLFDQIRKRGLEGVSDRCIDPRFDSTNGYENKMYIPEIEGKLPEGFTYQSHCTTPNSESITFSKDQLDDEKIIIRMERMGIKVQVKHSGPGNDWKILADVIEEIKTRGVHL